ncbi:hypothetical protein SAMN04489717_3660 [Actinopolymorpha singaporensis]|uniref:Uncharacterized protein n=1 Tax=Actinopolymorpha singaporensis TaxID=117157 RepID=A0A1H1UKD4_9ACTN|nr:hypothetical protein SAMN04489717_3660 [Actinopolymorpha singaporensis]
MAVASTDVSLLAAAVASLAVVALSQVQSSSQRSATAAASMLLCVVSVAPLWALVNPVYAFKCARLSAPGQMSSKRSEADV